MYGHYSQQELAEGEKRRLQIERETAEAVDNLLRNPPSRQFCCVVLIGMALIVAAIEFLVEDPPAKSSGKAIGTCLPMAAPKAAGHAVKCPKSTGR